MNPKNDSSTMGILEHLEELRQRLVHVIIALILSTVIGVFLTQPVLRALTAPLGERLPFASSPTTPPAVFIKIALLIGAVLAMPFIMYEIFQFVAPGLKPNERLYVLIGAPAAALSFALGVVFAATVLLPAAIPFLQGFLPGIVEQRYCINDYISFVGNVMMWAGIVFETPLVMFFLAKLGVIDHRGFAKVRRVVVIGAAVGAAIITPTTDPVNMLLVMIPFLVLYELGILLARLA